MCNGITVLNTRYNCMEKIQDNDADIMALDTGQAYFGGRYYNMMPFLAEKYSPGGAGRTISNNLLTKGKQKSSRFVVVDFKY